MKKSMARKIGILLVILLLAVLVLLQFRQVQQTASIPRGNRSPPRPISQAGCWGWTLDMARSK
jgi:hypothetical protein